MGIICNILATGEPVGNSSAVPSRPSHRASWSDTDVNLLLEGFSSGVSVRELARTLGRTQEAIRRKHRLLSSADPGSTEASYLERRALEETRLAAKSDDPRVRAVHDEMAKNYREVLRQTRRHISRAVE